MDDPLAERADELLRRATALRQRCERMNERLEELARAVPAAVPAAAPAAQPDQSEGVRLVATNLALSGLPRDEVDSRLRETFGAEDNGAILDEVFAATARQD